LLQLPQPIAILTSKTLSRFGSSTRRCGSLVDQFKRGAVRLKTRSPFLFRNRIIDLQAQLPNQHGQRQSLENKRRQNNAKREKQDVIARWKWIPVAQGKR